MKIVVDWTELCNDGEDERWHEEWCLYVYLHPEDNELLNIGKADRSTPWERLSGRHKDEVFEDIHREFGIEPHELGFLHGDLELPSGRRRSPELLTDVESLLIACLQPWGNIQSKNNRISRPGLKVTCVGDWPSDHWKFHDAG